MGLLLEIFNAQIYLQELKGFKKGITDADIKKHIIEESIYGVDIDAGAVDIARLGFGLAWLSKKKFLNRYQTSILKLFVLIP